jgi:hypothetical protein
MSSRFKIEEVSHGGHGGHGGFLNRSMNRNSVFALGQILSSDTPAKKTTQVPKFLAQVAEPQVLVSASQGERIAYRRIPT